WEITSEGRQIFEIAEEIEQSLTKLIADDAEAAVTGTVRIGAPEAFTGHIATPVLARVQRAHPALEIELFTSTQRDRKSTRLNSSHVSISYAVFCLKKKKHKY